MPQQQPRPAETGMGLTEQPLSSLEVFEAQQIPTLVLKVHGQPMDRMPEVFDAAFRAIFPAMAQHGLSPSGPAFALYHRAPDETADFEVGMPLAQAAPSTIEAVDGMRLEPSWLPGGRAARISHLGGYDQLSAAWAGFMGQVAAAGAAPEMPFWEVYVTEPRPGMDPSQLRTDLFTRVS